MKENQIMLEKTIGDSGTLVLEVNGESFITSNSVSNIEFQMFENNKFERIIPIHFKELNNKKQIQYDISGMSDLKYFIRNNKFTMEDFYKILINLINVISSSKNNMLNVNRFKIDSEHIYIQKNYFNVNLIYVPLKEYEADEEENIKELILEIAPFIIDLNGNEFKNVLHYLNNPKFNLGGLKDLLKELHKQQDEDLRMEDEEISTLNNNGKKNEYNTKLKSGLGIDKVETDKKHRLYSYILMVLGLLLIWMSFTPTSLFFMLLQPILSLVVIALGILYIMGYRIVKKERKIRVKTKEIEETEPEKDYATDKLNAEKLIASHLDEKNGKSKDISENTPSDRSEETTTKLTIQEPKNTEKHNDEVYTLKDQTMLLDLGDEEEDLDEKHNVIMDSSEAYYGSLYDEAVSKVIILNKTIKVGRSEDSDIKIIDKKASRNHFEISNIEDTAVITDLASNNGTYLNSEKLTPHKPYELSNQDIIKVLEKEFKFKK